MNKSFLIIIVVVLIVVLALFLFLNKNSNIIEESPIEENIVLSSGEIITENVENIIIEEEKIDKLNNLKEAMLSSQLFDTYECLSDEKAKELYEIEKSDLVDFFVLKSKTGNDEVCIIEIGDESVSEDMLLSLIKRHSVLSNNNEITSQISMKKRSNILFLIISDDYAEIEDFIEKEYLDK